MRRQGLKAHQRRISDAFEDGGSELLDSGDHVASVLVGRLGWYRLAAASN
jgi:hypothetical protein